MEQKERKYVNRAALVKAELKVNGPHKILDLIFRGFDPEKKQEAFFKKGLFLTEENNLRNLEVLSILGATNVQIANYESVLQLEGLGTKTADLVYELGEQGHPNVKFVNQPKFGVRVFDMSTGKDEKDDMPF